LHYALCISGFSTVIDFKEKDIYQLSKEFIPSPLLGKLQNSVCESIANGMILNEKQP